MPSTNSESEQVVTILKRSVGALLAFIGGLLIVGIGLVILGLVVSPENARFISSGGAFDRFVVFPLLQAFLILYFAFFAEAPIWILVYLPCHLLIPRRSILWQPWLCTALGAIAGAAGYWAESFWTTRGADLNNGPWLWKQAILAACVGASTCLVGSMIAKRSWEKEKRTLVVGSEQR